MERRRLDGPFSEDWVPAHARKVASGREEARAASGEEETGGRDGEVAHVVRPVWERVYIGRVIATVAVVVGIPLAVMFSTHASAGIGGAGPAGPPFTGDPETIEQPVDRDGTKELSDGMWANGPVRIAHQVNSAEAFAASGAFDAVEVDVRESDGNGDFRLMSSEDYGYRLGWLLDDCLVSGQMALLDIRYDSDPEGVAKMVADRGMTGRVMFQVPTPATARRICAVAPGALAILLNGPGDEEGIRIDELREYSDCLAGVSVCGSVVPADRAEEMVAEVKSVAGSDGRPMRLCLFAYGRRSDVYGCDELYGRLGVDMMMTDLCPERDGRAIEIAG